MAGTSSGRSSSILAPFAVVHAYLFARRVMKLYTDNLWRFERGVGMKYGFNLLEKVRNAKCR